jgi:hypothetical protein
VLGAFAATDNPNINLLFVSTRLKLIYPSPLILSVEKVPLPPQALLVLIVVRSYLVNDVVFHTSATTSSVPLYMDTAFFSSGSKLEEVTMLNAPNLLQ